jgi:hypothetical protein
VRMRYPQHHPLNPRQHCCARLQWTTVVRFQCPYVQQAQRTTVMHHLRKCCYYLPFVLHKAPQPRHYCAPLTLALCVLQPSAPQLTSPLPALSPKIAEQLAPILLLKLAVLCLHYFRLHPHQCPPLLVCVSTATDLLLVHHQAP